MDPREPKNVPDGTGEPVWVYVTAIAGAVAVGGVLLGCILVAIDKALGSL